jgi:prevent-host-death family protein
MKVVSKSKLKANMFEIFREIEASGEELIVTHHNKPVLRIVPISRGESVEAVMGELMGQIQYHADINEPTVDEWGDM